MTPSIPSAETLAEIDELFCGSRAPYGNYTRPGDSSGEVLIPDLVFRFRLLDPEKRSVSLQIYKGLQSLGGALWTREVRALLRVSAKGHPAIPNIVSGAYVDSHDLAFVITEAARHHLSDENAMAYVARDANEALRQFTQLTHGLSLLHEQGITHRNLWPGAIEYVEDQQEAVEASDRYQLRLSRFEMSAMVSNLLRWQLAGERLPHRDLRDLYLRSGASDPIYMPPERAQWLFGDDSKPAFLESDRSDVYSLGVLAWRWLIESPDVVQNGWDNVDASIDGIKSLNRLLRGGLQTSNKSGSLTKLLLDMLEWDPHRRPNIFEVLRRLTQDYGRLAATLGGNDESAAYYVGFMPVPSKQTIYKWGWIEQDPESDEGREQLHAFLQSELRGAEILYCPEGFSSYQRARDSREADSFRAAKYVLVGKQAYWFCDIWRERGTGYSKKRERLEQLLVIKYVRHHGRAWRLNEIPLRRRVPGELHLLPVWVDRDQDFSEPREVGAPWVPLFRTIEFERSTPAWMQVMDDAWTFLLAFRAIELESRIFPFETIDSSGEVHTLKVDVARDRKRQYDDPLRSLYFRTMRTPMARLFASLDSEATCPLAIYADDNGRPDYKSKPVAKVVFDARLDEDTIRVRVIKQTRRFVGIGWIRPDEDAGSFSQLRNQEDAVQELLRTRPLLHHLHAPVAIRGFRNRWQGVGSQLKGRGAEIVVDMLTSEPFFALHGPPGTGKTTVASVAVAAHLRSDASQRILISSQSHYALDNLARQVLDRCKLEAFDTVAVRIASAHAVTEEKVHPQLVSLLPERQAQAMIEVISRACKISAETGTLANGHQLTNDQKALVGEWRAQVPRIELEIRDRIRRGANLVFATTGSCTEANVATGGSGGLYDWVIIEEAARAWPTELALPLVRGNRWTLIGDHFQLPAFDQLSIHRFLDACADSSEEELLLHGKNRDRYLEQFGLFGNLFDKRAERRSASSRSTRLTEPLDELDLQFRMHPDICRVVSSAFYRRRVNPKTGEVEDSPGGWLRTDDETAKRAHGISAPTFLTRRSVVWIDTKNVPDSNDERAWRNQGEANLIATLLQRMRPPPSSTAARKDDAFALLSPYHAQLQLLATTELPDWAQPHLHTVDSFQGREADVVIVSLVRSVMRDPQRPESNIGYLVSPNRVNVLFSRARKLLCIVGRLSHFEGQATSNPDRQDVQFWQTIAAEIRAQDAIVDGAVLFEGGV
jgi:hypothetical protein